MSTEFYTFNEILAIISLVTGTGSCIPVVSFTKFTTIEPTVPVGLAVVVSVAGAAGLVFAMGDRARYWRRFTEREEEEEELPLGQRLIARDDCKSCHNTQNSRNLTFSTGFYYLSFILFK